MRRYWIALFAIVLGISGGVASNARAGVWTDSQAVLNVQSSVEVAAMPSTASCPTFYATVEIELIGKKRACIAGGPHSVVIVYENGSYLVAASGSPGGKRYLVEGVCTHGLSCFYSVATDSFVEKQYVGPYLKELKISRTFGDLMEWYFSPQHLRWGWKYTGPVEKESLKDTDGAALSSESIGMSENGQWIAAEVYERGIALINLQDGTVRRIQDQGYLYGRGMDPSHEYAIANDGSAVVVTGLNSGFTVVKVTPGCGQPLRQSNLSTPFPLGVVRCDTSSEGIGGGPLGVRMYGAPRMNEVARQITTVARMQSGALFLITLGYGDRAPSLPYIALGESFVSGQGEIDDTQYQLGTNEPFEKCHVSKRSYAYLLIPSGRNVACSGAQIPDLIGSPWYKGQGERLKDFLLEEQFAVAKTEALQQFIPGRIGQLDFVRTYQPEATTVSIGGNDIGLMDKLRSCIGPGTCEWAKPENLGKTAREIQSLHPRLVESYAQILATAPKTRLFVVGYPDVIRPAGKCDALTASLLNADERQYMQKTIQYLNQIVSSAAGSVGLRYVDLMNVFGEHGLCGSNTQKAMNGLRLGDDGALTSLIPELRVIGSESFHPTPFGHQLMADAIRRQTDGLKIEACTQQCIVSTSIPRPDTDWLVSPTTPRPVLRQVTKPVRSFAETQLQVTIPSKIFAADSEVELRIGQNTQRIKIEKDGGAEKMLLVALTAGYHTLEVDGSTANGEPIELYQVLYVEPEVKPVLSEAPSIKKNPVTSLKDQAMRSVSDEAAGLVGSISLTAPHSPSVIPTGMKVTTPTPVQRAEDPSVKQYSLEDYVLFIGLAVSTVGIIGTCLVFARLLRK